MAEMKTAFGKRLQGYGAWRNKVDADRFLRLAFLTADEKAAFCVRHFAGRKVWHDGRFAYIDGETVAQIVLKPAEECREVPEEQFTVSQQEGTSAANRFIIIAFLTADEKAAFCNRQFDGDESIVYMDGEDIALIVVKQ